MIIIWCVSLILASDFFRSLVINPLFTGTKGNSVFCRLETALFVQV